MIKNHIEYFKKNNPFYHELITSFEIIEDDSIETAGVTYDENINNIVLYINPKFFNTLSFNEQIAVLTHEIQHITNYHIVRGKGKDHFIYNMGSDMAINQFIKNLPKGCLFPTWRMKKKDSAEYYYNILNKHAKKKSSLFKSLQGKFSKDSKKGNHERWKGIDADKATKKIDEKIDKAYKEGKISKAEKKKIDKIKEEIKKELERKKSAGELEKTNERAKGSKGNSIHDDLRWFESLTVEDINWKVLLRNFVMKSFIRAKRSTIKVPNRRYNLPYGRVKAKVKKPRGIIAIDISPSISRPLLQLFKSEVEKIFPLFSEMRIILVDYDIRKDFNVKSKKGLDFSIPYGGGTDLCRVFEYVKNAKDYSFMIYFTDLEGEIPTKSLDPSIPVLWVVYGDYGNHNINFGSVIKIKK